LNHLNRFDKAKADFRYKKRLLAEHARREQEEQRQEWQNQQSLKNVAIIEKCKHTNASAKERVRYNLAFYRLRYSCRMSINTIAHIVYGPILSPRGFSEALKHVRNHIGQGYAFLCGNDVECPFHSFFTSKDEQQKK
jgi:hypothetical protein